MDALVASVQSLNVDLLATHTYTNSSDILTETYAYDAARQKVGAVSSDGVLLRLVR